jgi:N-acetyl-1-D-myo-inositol-2-amino-2-deoxy-alpha-D-glucopyranoside deacetylase
MSPSSRRAMGAAARVLPLVFAFAVGAGTGFVLTFTHRQFLLDLAGVTLPLGLIGGLAIVGALIAGMRLAFAERAAPIAAAAGVILGSAVLVLPGNSGSLYIPDDPVGYVWALAPTVLAIIIIGWPARRPVIDDPDDG